MEDWKRRHQKLKLEKAKRQVHACGRTDFTSVTQITKDTYICFIRSIEENSDPILATSITERSGKKERIVKYPPTKKQRDVEEATCPSVVNESVAAVEEDTSTEIDMEAISENTKAIQTDIATEKAVVDAQ